MVKSSPAVQETQVLSLSREDPLGKEMATHSSILACRIPWTEEPSGLQSLGSQRVAHDWATEQQQWNLWQFPGGSVVQNLPYNAGDVGSIPGLGRSSGEGNGNLLPYPRDWGAWWATVHGVKRAGHNLETKPPPPPKSWTCVHLISVWIKMIFDIFKIHRILPRPSPLNR